MVAGSKASSFDSSNDARLRCPRRIQLRSKVPLSESVDQPRFFVRVSRIAASRASRAFFAAWKALARACGDSASSEKGSAISTLGFGGSQKSMWETT